MFISHAALSKLNHLINYSLELDPHSHVLINKLANQSLRVTLKGTPCDLIFYCCNNQLLIKPFDSSKYDASISGAPLTLIKIAITQQIDSSLSIEITGNLSTIDSFRKLISTLEIDWEEQLSRLIGESAGVALHQRVKNSLHWLKNMSTNFCQNLTEISQEEYQLFPSRAECEQFYNEVDDINLETERLEKKLFYLDTFISGEETNS